MTVTTSGSACVFSSVPAMHAAYQQMPQPRGHWALPAAVVDAQNDHCADHCPAPQGDHDEEESH